jgi:Ni,Fe-hydrogenase III large subunit
MTALRPMASGAAVPLAEVPRLPLGSLRAAILEAPARGRRVSALFASQGTLYAILADDDAGLLECGRAELGAELASMTAGCPEVDRFERELAEEHGVTVTGHPWLRAMRRLRAGDFFRVEGDEIHEVAVGPVHAGVIEPGHFRFQCHGERVFHLEIALGYQHRGVERRLAGGPDKRTIHQIETVAGDTSVGHATAYCQVLEALGGRHATPRGLALRGVALELERLANHTGDLGALAGDVGFLPSASYCGRLRGDFLNLTGLLCGSRFGRGLVRPGGAAFDLDEVRIDEMLRRLDAAFADVAGAARLLWATPTVMARFEDTGRITRETAVELGLVGPAARATGLRRDVRKTHPSGIFQVVHIPLSTAESGDVFARAYVRWLEIERSTEYVRAQLRELPRGAARREVPPPRPAMLAAALVEGWRGEVCHAAITDERGRFAAYKIVDPSFHNWPGLEAAMRDQQISDFPLCNKSFNLSYCGHDL